MNPTALPTVAGIEVTMDSEGRFNLNALHKASGGRRTKRPVHWLALEATKCLISERGQDSDLAQEVIKVIRGGHHQGTYADELLAISYAGWISPSFQLQVNQTFLDFRMGKLKPVEKPALSLVELLERALESEKEKERLSKELEDKTETIDRIATAQGSMNLTASAKHLQVKPRALNKALLKKGWLYRRSFSGPLLGMQAQVDKGNLEHKVTTLYCAEGNPFVAEQVRVTPKGLTALSKLIQQEKLFDL